MEVLKGVCLPWNRGVAIGRLCFSREQVETEASLLVCEEIPRGLPNAAVAGILLRAEERGPFVLVPPLFCPVMTIDGLDPSMEGQIAIMDGDRGTLWISPDLETVGRYAAKKGEQARAEEFSVWGVSEGLPMEESPAAGWVLATSSAEDEEGLYERYREAAEQRTGLPLMTFVPLGEREGMRRRLRALYRGAVYGRFSLLFTGVATEGEWERCRDLCHEVFCDLESEGREFNGYLPKGVLLDRGMTLLRFPKESRPDYLCVDAEALYGSLTGNGELLRERIEVLGEALRTVGEDKRMYFMVRDPARWEVTRELLSCRPSWADGIIVPQSLFQ